MTLRSDFPKIILNLPKATGAQRLKIAHKVRNNAIELILRGPKSGRIYGNHQASAPGESPASDTARLVQGIVVRDDPARNTTFVVSTANYSMALEYGNARIAPRPFMRPALVKITKADIETGFKVQ